MAAQPETFRAASGFTLLEVLVAVAIGVLLVAASYTLIGNAAALQGRSEERARQLQDLLYLKRILQRDMMALLESTEDQPSISGKDAALTLRCSGEVVNRMALGPQVTVRYSWKEVPGGMIFERTPLSAAGKTLAAYRLRINDGVERVDYELLDQTGWKKPYESTTPPVRAIRLFLEWSDLGRWEMVFSANERKGTASIEAGEELKPQNGREGPQRARKRESR